MKKYYLIIFILVTVIVYIYNNCGLFINIVNHNNQNIYDIKIYDNMNKEILFVNELTAENKIIKRIFYSGSATNFNISYVYNFKKIKVKIDNYIEPYFGGEINFIIKKNNVEYFDKVKIYPCLNM